MTFTVLSVDAVSGTMVIDWGQTTLNHYIPQQVLNDPSLDSVAVLSILEALRPVVPDPVVIPESLIGLVQGASADEMERFWRDNELAAVTWLRDRHRDQLEIGIETTLTAELFAELLVYMQALRDWPQSDAFPDSAQRPVAPSWIADQVL